MTDAFPYRTIETRRTEMSKHLDSDQPPICYHARAQSLVDDIHLEGLLLKSEVDSLKLQLERPEGLAAALSEMNQDDVFNTFSLVLLPWREEVPANPNRPSHCWVRRDVTGKLVAGFFSEKDKEWVDNDLSGQGHILL
jgi:hypothetical protein